MLVYPEQEWTRLRTKKPGIAESEEIKTEPLLLSH